MENSDRTLASYGQAGQERPDYLLRMGFSSE